MEGVVSRLPAEAFHTIHDEARIVSCLLNQIERGGRLGDGLAPIPIPEPNLPSAVRYLRLEGSGSASLDAQTAWPPADQSQPSCQARMKDRDQDNRPSGLRRSR